MPTIKTVSDAIDHELIVVEAFPGFVKGQIIAEAAKIKELLESEWAAHVVKKAIQTPADPAAS